MPEQKRLVITAGVTTGLIPAGFCFLLLGLPAFMIAVGSIPLGIGGAYLGLVLGRHRGKQDVRAWIWSGAAVAGVVGSLLAYACLFLFVIVFVMGSG